MTIKLFNTLTKQIDVFTPIEGNAVKMYSCGPTVYNYAHIGNLRAFLFPDLLQRVLRVVGGYSVQWVMNITDIDDKTIRSSAVGAETWLSEMGAQSSDPKENLRTFTRFYAKEFLADLETIGIQRRDFFEIPFATEYIVAMQELIKRIFDNGLAYVADGSVYFSVSEWRKRDKYGVLFHIDQENFREGVRIDADEYERDSVSDFVLWKGKKEGEPFWEFELDGHDCAGRPGWHVECSAMEFEILGLPFDIHTGGVDLRFPHHEDEIAQSKAGYGIEPCPYWCHNEHLWVEGKKMSKSLGNYYTLRDLLQKGIDPLDFRFTMLSTHHASVFNFTFDGLKASAKARVRIQEYIYDLLESNGSSNFDVDGLRASVFSELADNLHTPKALAQLFTFLSHHVAAEASSDSRQKLLEFFSELNDVFGVWELTARPESALTIPDEVNTMAEERWQAKRARDFTRADVLRQAILERGFTVLDSKDGFTVEKLVP